ncbi:hypothetical protein BG006_007097 [Podila minutissima]|uniref:Pre-rRNA-processing protein n=1 Tax=Podila minutissima TaxID=64525 RepID=A0A9P5SW05_9FUNG|nr:hypothetical protein BG006_007097 [Podila minutissima]
MPKSSSKRKKEKNADFKKTKLKVGKKKAVADSFTDTSFKSKAISLPSQSICHDKTALLTNSRNVTFVELMTQLKHFSPGTRKDALLGLRDLFHRHPHLLPLHLGVLINTAVRLLIDDSIVVRRALQTFLGEFVPMLHPRDIHPFLPLLIVYTCSAMTHILEDIREDALKFMDIWVACGGQVVVNGFWDKILPNYISLLTSDSNATNASKLTSAMSFSASATSGMVGSGSGSSGSGAKVVAGASTGKNAPGSLKAKSEVLQSLAGFLQEGLGGEGGEGGEKDPYWFLRNFLGTAHARKSFNTSRTQLGVHDRSNKTSSKKRKASSKSSSSSGRSKRGPKNDESGDSDEDDEDDEDEDSESSEEEISESEDASQSEKLAPENDRFDPSPVVSFASAQSRHQLLTSFPVHPSITQSYAAQAIFGQAQEQGSDASTSTVSIKIFPQQGGASASGAGANVGVSGSGKTGNLGGVQGRLHQIRPLIATLHPLLLSVWLDTAPTVFSTTTAIHANHALTIVHLVMQIWGILWRAALAKPKKKSVDSEEEQRAEEADEKWLDEYLQNTVGMTDVKVASLLQDMNTTYCELTSLFMLGIGIGQIRRVHKDTIAKSTQKLEKAKAKKTKISTKTSYRPSNKSVKKVEQVKHAESSDDYDSEEDVNEEPEAGDNMISFQVEAPKWADQVVMFVLTSLGWSNPDKDEDEEESLGVSSDFKSEHLVALLPTLWTLLNCLETERKEWVFEALMSYFDAAHVQSGAKRVVLQFLSLIIKLQSHPHYTGSFSIMVPGSRVSVTRRTLSGLSKRERKEQQASILKQSKQLSTSLLKLPKLLWDLGTERIETSQTILDLLAWVAMIAGDDRAGAAYEEERVQFLKTLQSYMSLFFCVTMGKGGEKRTVMGPFVRLPPALQRRAIEIVYYTGVLSTDFSLGETKAQRKLDTEAQKAPLLVAVKSCCKAGDLSDETRLYIEETLRIR